FPSRGVSIRVFDGGAFHESATASTSPDALRRAAQALQGDVTRAKDRYKIEPLTPQTQTWRTPMKRDPASVPLAERVGLVDAEFERCNWDDPRVRSARVGTEVIAVRRLFVDGNRRLVNDATMTSHTLTLFGFDKGRPGFAFKRRIGFGDLELARMEDAELEEMRKEFIESFGTEQVP